MDQVDVERLGGFPGFGGPGGRLKSNGTVDLQTLPQVDRDRIQALFRNPPSSTPSLLDAFRYRLTHHTSSGPKTIEVADQYLPAALNLAVHDAIE
jgi:hypothetical protein